MTFTHDDRLTLRRWFLVCVLLAFVAACAEGQNYASHPAMLAFTERLVDEDGFEREELERLFAAAERQDSILEAIARPAEKTKPWHEYRQIFVTDKRTRQGVAFMRKHGETLARAQTETGVPASIIAAILGVETFYGRITGSYRVVNALATLAFDYPPRSDFFTRELRHFLILTREQGLEPLALKGSYAGAMGYGQFMPSSYRSYAVDFDGDGSVDIWDNPVDAIGSVANYLKQHGWRPDENIILPARRSGGIPDSWINAGLKPERSLAQLIAAGLEPLGDAPDDALATGLAMQGDEDIEYWIGLHNFYVITRYNHSAMYALSVYQLSQRLQAELGE
ncbi:MAG: lytic murein transglycosylase B [Chromatocurvus sp.]